MTFFLTCLLSVTLPAAQGTTGAGAPAAGEKVHLEEPVDISSDSLVVEHDKSRAVFSGQVSIRQDRLEITCDKLVVEYGRADAEAPAIERMLFSGQVKISMDERRGGCRSAEYLRSVRRVVCSGDAWLTQGQNRITGETIEYHLESRRVTVRKPKAVLHLEKQPAAEGKKPDGSAR